jgi:cobyrinic acid a,c-diamide synthase
VNLPRLIIADEATPGMVAPGVVLAYAMKRAGVKVKVFTCARTEAEMRLLRLLMEEPVVSLDTYACGSIKNLKTLFQKTADPEALNVVVVPLGSRTDEEFIQVQPEALDLAKSLSCGIVVSLTGAGSPALTTNVTSAVLETFGTGNENYVLGVVFTSVKSGRDYQLLEQDYGRKTAIISLGYIPKEIERPMPSLLDMYNPAAGTRIMQIKSAAIQLASTIHQVEWQILDAFGHLKQDWTSPQESRYPAKNFKAAIVGDKRLSLEGCNSRELFRYLGCEVIDYDPWEDRFPLDAEVVYFPHSVAALYTDALLLHPPFFQGMKQAFAANKLIFANGASAPFFGQYYLTTGGQKHEGLKFFPFHGSYPSPTKRDETHKIEIRGTGDSIFSKNDEKMRGYLLDYVHISNPGNPIPPVLSYRDIRKNVEIGSSGWSKGYCFVTDLHVELWSNIDVVNRWLSLRKR